MQNKIFAAALSIANPWYIKGVGFDADQKSLYPSDYPAAAADMDRHAAR